MIQQREILPKPTKRSPSPSTAHRFNADVEPKASIRIFGQYLVKTVTGDEPTLFDEIFAEAQVDPRAYGPLADLFEERGHFATAYIRRLCNSLMMGVTVGGEVETIRSHVLAQRERVPLWQSFDRTFRMGDRVETGSYNLIYTGEIVAIGPQTVTTRWHGERRERFDLHTFIMRNWDLDLEKIARHNATESMYI